jgi:hypothetical protein
MVQKNYHTAGFPQVDVVFQISIALAYSALASAGVAFVIAVLLLIFTNNQRLSVRCVSKLPLTARANPAQSLTPSLSFRTQFHQRP